jgi:hypothetical protein
MLRNSTTLTAVGDVQRSNEDLSASPIDNRISQSPPRNLRNQYYWRREGILTSFAVSGTIPTAGAKSFQLSDVFDATNLSKVYDQYCIFAVSVSFAPANSALPVANASLGVLTSVIDFSDVTLLASTNEANSYSTALHQQITMGKSQQREFMPCSSSAQYLTAVTTGYGPTRQWIDINSPSVPHFGLKYYFEGASVGYTMDVFIDYLFGFRSSK